MNLEGHKNPCKISVVIPNWNGMDYLPDCLLSLQNQTLGDFEFIMVDNGSSDNSVDFIRTNYPGAKLITLPENTGFARACNLGIGAAEGRYVALLNNDTMPMPPWLESLINAAERDERIGMVASKILLNLETREIDSVGMLLYPDGIGRQRGRGEIDNGQFDQEEEILFPSGCAALYKMEMLQEIGLFDEDFFAYGEDTDIGLRGRLAGWKAVFAPRAVVYHRYSASAGKYSSFKAMHLERNRIWVAVKNFPLTWVFKMPFYTLIRYTTQLYGVFIGKGSAARYKENLSVRDMLFSVIKANFLAMKGLPSMLKKRKAIKRTILQDQFIAILKRYRISLTDLVFKN